jgi:hypothetical protein
VLPDSAARISFLAADLGLDLIEFGDPLQDLGGDRRGWRFGYVEPAPSS